MEIDGSGYWDSKCVGGFAKSVWGLLSVLGLIFFGFCGLSLGFLIC